MSDRFSDDDGFYDTEDEEWDAPITASWGVPAAAARAAPETQDQSNGTVDVKGWHQIADPNAKIRADGVGAGNLHRKGKNFQPVDEQQILNQRLGKAIPKNKSKQIAVSKKTKKVSIQPIAGNKPPHVMSDPGTGKKAAKKARASVTSAAAERARAVEREGAAKQPDKPMANPDPHVNSVWKAGTSLVDTPFWEQASSRQSIHAPPPANAAARAPVPAPVHTPARASARAPAKVPAKAPATQTTKERKSQPTTQSAPSKENTKFTFVPPFDFQQPPNFTFVPPSEFQQPPKSKVEFQIKGAAESVRKVKAANAAVASDVQNKSKSGKREITIGLPKSNQAPKVPTSTAKPVTPPAAPAPTIAKSAKPAQPAQPAKVTKPKPSKPAPQPTKSAPPLNKTGAGSSDSRWASTPSSTSSTLRNHAADNPILVTLNIELEKGEALPIIVRAKDDPKELATAFAERLSQRKNNIPIDNNIVQALTQLIEQKIRDKRI